MSLSVHLTSLDGMNTNRPVALLTLRSISKHYGGVAALRDVSFDVAPGAFHAVVGENGAGKSTLMNILAGVVGGYAGEVHLGGRLLRVDGPRAAEAAGIRMIHQELHLVEQLSAAANVFLGRERCGRWGLLDSRAMRRRTRELFAELECEIDPAAPASTLRVGDQQLVEIAKALLVAQSDARAGSTTAQPLAGRLLIMDEPTSALTTTETARLFRVIDRLRSQGITVLYISHKMDEVFQHADTITVLRDGSHVTTLPRSQTTPQQITHSMVGRELDATSGAAGRSPGAVVLEVAGLRLPMPAGHARRWRLKKISFELRAGEVLGVAGLMGAGRTELLESLFGIADPPAQGRIVLQGRAVRFTHPAQAVAAGVALVTEDRKRLGLFSQLSVRKNITACTLERLTRGGLLSAARERQAALLSIQQLGIKTAGPEAAITSLSGGNQQKCIIARWLRTEPAVLLLDDPTRGIDVGAKSEIYRVINDLCRQGLGIIVTSSELPELMTLCDRILVLCEGRLTGEFDRSAFREAAIMEAATDRSLPD